VSYENEFTRVRRVVLYRPTIDEITQQDAQTAMYMELPDSAKVLREFDGIVAKLRELQIEVIVLEPSKEMPDTSNMIFLRDVAFVFREVIVLANMKYPLRQDEPGKFKELLLQVSPDLKDSFVELDSTISMEGADLLAINKNLVYAYVGSRTDKGIISFLSRTFENVEGKVVKANIHGVPQHILGGVHIINDRLATRRIKYCQDTIEDFEYIDFDEDTETSDGFALNIVTVAPGEILMPANNPMTRKKLESRGVICHEVEVSEIHKMGGGLACMVLPLARR